MNTTASKSTKDKTETESEVETLANRMFELRKEVQSLVDQLGSVGSAAQHDIVSAARARAAKGIEAGEHIAADLADDWRAIDRRVVTATRDSPWRTLGLAAAIGLLLGLVLRR